MRLPKGYKVLKPVHPNAGIEADYRLRLDALIDEMQASYDYWLSAAYRANQPEMAQDALAAAPVRVTAVQSYIGKNNLAWLIYVDGAPLRGRDGQLRTFRSRDAAETAGLRSAGWNTRLTQAVPIGARMDRETLASLPIVLTPAANLDEALAALGARWEARFDLAAPQLGRWFANENGKRSQAGLKKILKDGGMTVQFQVTPAMRDVFDATVAENVGLIRSIASQYHTEVQGMVMRSVTAGRDLAMLTGELEDRFGITRRRAAGIALDQNNKATSNFVKVRQAEHDLLAVWLHSHAGKVPRPTHVANSGKVYDPKVGWYDPDPKVRKRIWPGMLIKCRCVSRTVVKGFS